MLTSSHNQSEQHAARKFGLAFLGGAFDSAVGRVHRTACAMDQRFELRAGCFSRDSESNKVAAAQYGLDPESICGSFDEVLERRADGIDAIVILTPTDQHRGQVLKCLEAGVPVICEKALATSVSEIQAIKESLFRNDGFLSVTYNYTGYPMLRELRRMVLSRRFGRVRQIHVEMPQDGFARIGADGMPLSPQSWRLRDGPIPTISLDLGVHLHMMIRFLINMEPTEVVAVSDTFGNFSQIVDNVSCIVRYGEDLTCNVWFSKTALGYRNGLRLRLFGELGAAEWQQEAPEYLYLTDSFGNKSIVDRASQNAMVANQLRYGRFKVGHPSGFIEAFANYYSDIADALQVYLNGGRQSNEYVFGIEEALQGSLLLQAVADSSASRSWMPIGVQV